MPITFNRENFERVLNHIKAHPETWKQSKWHCGTSHCFAGHAQIMAGNAPNNKTVRRDARIFLGLTRYEADRMFASSRSIADFEAFLSDGYNRAGHDRAGYDRDGYNRADYDRAGYNRAGYDRAGYDRDGYNRDGYDRAGYNRAGYDRAGYNRDGYDRDGLDCDNAPRPARPPA